MEKKNYSALLLIPVVLAIFWFYNSDSNKWTGFLYTLPDSYEEVLTSPKLKSLDECRAWVSEQRAILHLPNAEYECGKGCKYQAEYDLSVCSETVE